MARKKVGLYISQDGVGLEDKNGVYVGLIPGGVDFDEAEEKRALTVKQVSELKAAGFEFEEITSMWKAGAVQ